MDIKKIGSQRLRSLDTFSNFCGLKRALIEPLQVRCRKSLVGFNESLDLS